MVRDISDRTRAEEQLGVLSTRDDLTGLLNRRGFRETVRPLIAGAQRVASG
jgi:GGDEF domain-containing protein